MTVGAFQARACCCDDGVPGDEYTQRLLYWKCDGTVGTASVGGACLWRSSVQATFSGSYDRTRGEAPFQQTEDDTYAITVDSDVYVGGFIYQWRVVDAGGSPGGDFFPSEADITSYLGTIVPGPASTNFETSAGRRVVLGTTSDSQYVVYRTPVRRVATVAESYTGVSVNATSVVAGTTSSDGTYTNASWSATVVGRAGAGIDIDMDIEGPVFLQATGIDFPGSSQGVQTAVARASLSESSGGESRFSILLTGSNQPKDAPPGSGFPDTDLVCGTDAYAATVTDGPIPFRGTYDYQYTHTAGDGSNLSQTFGFSYDYAYSDLPSSLASTIEMAGTASQTGTWTRVLGLRDTIGTTPAAVTTFIDNFVQAEADAQ